MWWPLMQSLGNWLQADADLAGVSVLYGAVNPFPETDFIELQYGGSPSFDLSANDRGDAELWANVFSRLDRADADPAAQTGVAYQQLDALQGRVLSSVGEWFRTTAAVNGATFNAQTREIQPDGELFRADEFAACRIVLNINWRNQ